jgi:site-specific recombinase XerD
MALQKFKRHTAKCCKDKGIKRDDRTFTKCRCPWQVEGTLRIDGFIRKSTGETDAEKADEWLRLWSDAGTVDLPSTKSVGVTVDHAVSKFIEGVKGENLADSTQRKFSTILNALAAFCEIRGLRRLVDLHPEQLQDFRATWQYSPIAAQKHIERLRKFFRYCITMRWIKESPCELKIKVTRSQKQPFSQAQIDAIMDALSTIEDEDGHWYRGVTRVRAFIYAMLYGGLAISDATKLRPGDIRDGLLIIRRRKSLGDSIVPLPDGSDERPDVVSYLAKLKPECEEYLFWSARGALDTAVTNWATRLARIFSKAGIEGCPTHRFRHTFAATHLSKGVPIETVSRMLGHGSVTMTEKYYAAWSKGRQDLLIEQVKNAWTAPKLKLVKGHKKPA